MQISWTLYRPCTARYGLPCPRASPQRLARGKLVAPSDAPSSNCLGASGSGSWTSRRRSWQRARLRLGCIRRRLLRCRSARRPAKPLLPLPRLRAGGSGAKRACGGGRRRRLRLLPLQAPLSAGPRLLLPHRPLREMCSVLGLLVSLSPVQSVRGQTSRSAVGTWT